MYPHVCGMFVGKRTTSTFHAFVKNGGEGHVTTAMAARQKVRVVDTSVQQGKCRVLLRRVHRIASCSKGTILLPAPVNHGHFKIEKCLASSLRPQNILRVSLDGRSLVLPLIAMLLFPCFLEDFDNFALGILHRRNL